MKAISTMTMLVITATSISRPCPATIAPIPHCRSVVPKYVEETTICT
jgi:hypothetical protein